MKKNLLMTGLFALCMTLSFTACSDDDDNNSNAEEAANIDVTQDNVDIWAAYMTVVAKKLANDSETLYNDWNVSYNGGQSYADLFKNHNGGGFNSSMDCIEQVLDGCADIANEVGSAKIGDPYNLYTSGHTTEALYAVESWYSWHSIDDYSNNIISIRNAYYGTRYADDTEKNLFALTSDDEAVSEHSIFKFVSELDEDLATDVDNYIEAAYLAIQNIPAPFRNHIVCDESLAAMEACANLEEVITNRLKPFLTNLTLTAEQESELDEVVNTYVDDVVLPTYSALVECNQSLLSAVETFKTNPTDENLAVCASLWMVAREPWETSEAFLFGPVADKGLDPNMDSWPLDQAGIVKILNSGDYNALDWSGEYDEDSEAISEAQSLRGYHTLEFLTFKNGEARTIVGAK